MKEIMLREKKILKSTLYTILSLSFVLSTILLLSFYENYYSEKLRISHDLNYNMYDFFSLLQDAETGQRGYLLTLDETYLEPYYASLTQISSKQKEIINTLGKDSVRNAYIDEIMSLKEKKIQELVHTTSLAKLGRRNEAMEILNSDVGQTNMSLIRKAISNLKKVENTRIVELRSKYFAYKRIIFFLFFAALLVTGYNYYHVHSQLKPLIHKLKSLNETLNLNNAEKDKEIERRKNIETINSQLLINLEKKNRDLNHFAYIASHDLQEPLRTVRNFISLYKEEFGEEQNETAQTYFQFIDDASIRMSKLIHGLLLYSKIGSSDSVHKLDIKTLIEEAIANLSALISDKNVSIEISDMPTLNVYKIEMVQLFQNLIQNAIKFSQNKPIIKINVIEKEDSFCFSVNDNGIGMEQSKTNKIFNMFARLHSEKNYQGQGIGLAFCKKIVELHNGEIWVESKLGEGATFYFTIQKNLAHV